MLESQLACQAQRFKRSESGLVLTGHVINRVACCAWRCVACWHRSWLRCLLLPHTWRTRFTSLVALLAACVLIRRQKQVAVSREIL